MLTWLEINKKAIEHNLCAFRRLIGRSALLMPVVKANAYGHGFLEVAKICDESGEADRIRVVNLDEALALLDAGIKKPIMILSFYELDKAKITRAIKNKIIFPLYSLEQAKFLNAVGERVGKKAIMHLKVDTGAARIGILPGDAVNFYQKIKLFKNLNIEGLFSHFASSEEDREYTDKQYKLFNKVATDLEQAGCKFKIRHMACSAASVVYPDSQFNAVRLGLGLYGLYPAQSVKDKLKLKPVLSWKTKIIQIKTLPAGAKVGYGGTFVTKKPTKLAILPTGYFDGYDRRFSNTAQVVVHGVKCPVRGRICMNLTMVDVSGVLNIQIGDEVVLLGKMGKNEISADYLAKLAKTINYEIVSRINPLLPRKVK